MKLIEKNINSYQKHENVYSSEIIDSEINFKDTNSDSLNTFTEINNDLNNTFIEDVHLKRTNSECEHDYEIIVTIDPEEDTEKLWNEIEDKLEEFEKSLIPENETKTFKAQYEDEILDFQIEFDDLGENYSFFDENGQLQEHQSNLKKVSKIFLDKFNEIYEEFELNQFLHDLVDGESVTLKGMTFSY